MCQSVMHDVDLRLSVPVMQDSFLVCQFVIFSQSSKSAQCSWLSEDGPPEERGEEHGVCRE